ncbi:OmpA family protein [Parvularcula sp. LCG005]|uniref:OmpA family protein n=1 Tax=Parvularcula sp. LCG005 TaxID=3078805 RepID=UPI002941DE9A|nr:OmpA family protein [Parvularcula sp. LCG005]WOI52715.1 OmpA family protein [Parvularcula sp. LCG005]
MKKFLIGAVAVTASLAMTACTTTDPYTGERKVSNTAKGGAIGAVAGGVIGAIAGDDEAALAGAAAGAALGAGVGNYMDRQEQELRRELASTGVRVQRNGDNIRLIMPGNITFPTNQSSVRPEFYATLNSVSKVLEKYNRTSVLVEGHTDNVGADEYNLNLSIARAESVGQYLADQGVAIPRIRALGYGETQPIQSNATDEGRAQNRRVEIQLSPVQS